MQYALILDDVQERHDTIKRMCLRDANICVVSTFSYVGFVDKVKAHKYDIMFLDHDLGAGPTGYDAAKHISDLPVEERPYKVIIHSMNYAGRARMLDLLKSVGIDAVCWPIVDIIQSNL